MQQIPFVDVFKWALHVSGNTINKRSLLHLVGCLHRCSNDARSHKHQVHKCQTGKRNTLIQEHKEKTV